MNSSVNCIIKRFWQSLNSHPLSGWQMSKVHKTIKINTNAQFVYMYCFLTVSKITEFVWSTKLISFDAMGFTWNCQGLVLDCVADWHSGWQNVLETAGASDFNLFLVVLSFRWFSLFSFFLLTRVWAIVFFSPRWFLFCWFSWSTSVWARWQPATHRIENAPVQTPHRGSQFFVIKAFEPTLTGSLF